MCEEKYETLAQNAAKDVDALTPLGEQALAIYKQFADEGFGGTDFSGIIKKMQSK